MKYKLSSNTIEIEDKEDFDAEHILECGQVFSFQKTDKGYVVWSKDKMCQIEETVKGWTIRTDDVEYFENYFDLKTDYSKIKKHLQQYPILQKPIEYGHGIRILKQDLFETVISFIVSANNNIKRIKMILQRIRERFGTKKDGFFAFPTRKQLLQATEQDFAELGAGYRAKYLFEVVRQLDDQTLQCWASLPTVQLRKQLMSLMGVGPKVADCILLFGYGKGDVFPVDTWIAQMYNRFYEKEENRERIRNLLTNQFERLSGYAQQYLFFYMRAGQ